MSMIFITIAKLIFFKFIFSTSKWFIIISPKSHLLLFSSWEKIYKSPFYGLVSWPLFKLVMSMPNWTLSILRSYHFILSFWNIFNWFGNLTAHGKFIQSVNSWEDSALHVNRDFVLLTAVAPSPRNYCWHREGTQKTVNLNAKLSTLF